MQKVMSLVVWKFDRLQTFAFPFCDGLCTSCHEVPYLALSPTPCPLQALLCLPFSLMWQLSFYFLLKSGLPILGWVMIINSLLFAYCETWWCCLFVKVYEIVVHWKFALRAEPGATHFDVGNCQLVSFCIDFLGSCMLEYSLPVLLAFLVDLCSWISSRRRLSKWLDKAFVVLPLLIESAKWIKCQQMRRN